MRQEPASSQAVWALVLGIVGLLMCQVLCPIAWWLGATELRNIRAGLSPTSGQGLATAGMILGIIGTLLLVLGCCGALFWWLFVIGALAGGLAFL